MIKCSNTKDFVQSLAVLDENQKNTNPRKQKMYLVCFPESIEHNDYYWAIYLQVSGLATFICLQSSSST